VFAGRSAPVVVAMRRTVHAGQGSTVPPRSNASDNQAAIDRARRDARRLAKSRELRLRSL